MSQSVPVPLTVKTLFLCRPAMEQANVISEDVDVPPQSMYPEQDTFIWDEDWFNEPPQPPAKKMKTEGVPEGDKVPTKSYDTPRQVSARVEMQPGTPPLDAIWANLPRLHGEDVPPRRKSDTSARAIERDVQRQRIIRRWNLDRTAKIIVAPEGVRFLNATVFTLSAEEWRTWCAEWKSDSTTLLLSQDGKDKCTLQRTDYGMELKRERGLKTSKFQLSRDQLTGLERRATYVTSHVDLLASSTVPINIMKSVIANKMIEMAAKLNIGATYPMFMNETFQEVYENAVSLGITGEVLSDFGTEMQLRGLKCELDHYSVLFYCMFQIADLRELLL